MKHIIIMALLLISASSAMALPLPIGGSNEPITAFACKNCSFEDAKNIAIQNAPENNCSIYENGSIATYCEPVTETILVPVHVTEDVYKFFVTTSIDSRNRPKVSVYSGFAISTIESALMTKYLDFYKDFEAAVNSASISTEELPPLPEFTSGNKSFFLSSSNDNCSSHPTKYFKGINDKREIRSNLASRITASIRGSSAAEYENEPLVSGLSIDMGIDGVGASISSHYVKNDLIVTRGNSFNNRLAFTVSLYTDPTKGNQPLFSLSLHRGLTKIDGFRYSEIFGGDNIDMTNVQMTNCLREFLQQGEQVDESTMTGGGDGSFENPFEGGDILNGDDKDWCRVRTKIRTCIEQPNGGQICTVTTYNWTELCTSTL